MSILAFTDGSEQATRMLPHAAALARGTRRPLVVIRVMNRLRDLAGVVATSTDDAAAALADRWRAAIAQELRLLGVEGSVAIETQRPGEETAAAICRIADERGAHALAFGSHGAGLLRHLVVGSTALGVLGRTQRPCLVVGPHVDAPAASGGGPYRLAVCSDGSPTAARVVEAMRPLLEATDVAVELLSLYEPRLGDRGREREMAELRAHLEQLAAALPPVGSVAISVEELEDLESVDHGILRFAAARRANAVALATHGYSARHHLVSGSTAVGLLQHGHLPTILVRSVA